MTADEFIRIVRNGSDKLRVDGIILNTGTKELRGNGMMRIAKEEIELDLVLNPGEELPQIETGVYTKSDYWKLSGMIEDCLKFRSDYVRGGRSTRFFASGVTQVRITFDVSPIELIPSGLDTLTRQERAQLKEKLQRQLTEKTEREDTFSSINTAERVPLDSSVSFYARLRDYPLPRQLCKGTNVIEKNPYLGDRPSGRLDTLMGEIEGYDFAFIKETDESDVFVYFESKQGYCSPSEEDDWKKFFALMNALAFTLGVHAWPYRVEYWRDGRKMTDRITSARRLARTVHAPFHLQNFDFQDVIKKAATFFESNSTLAHEVGHILFLFREADYEKVHGDIIMITLCVLFETLINQLFKELKLDEKARLLGMTKINMRERFRLVADHFGLQWQNDMEIIFKTWQKIQDPLIHGHGRANESEAEMKQLMLDESRIAGALNLLLLKLFGYSGKMRASAFEAEYRNV